MPSKLSSIIDNMQQMDSEDIEIKKDFFGIFFGNIGTGKTTFVSGLAQQLKGEGKILYLDSANGWVSLENTPALMADMVRYRVKSPSDLMAIANALKEAKKGFGDFTVLIIDELSSIAAQILSMALADRLGIGEDEIPDDVPQQKDYLSAQTAVVSIIKKLVELEGLHVILTAHDKDKVDRATGEILSTGPDFQPGIMKNISKDLHVVGQVTAKVGRSAKSKKPKYTREIQVLPSSRVAAKTRIGGFDLKNSFGETAQRISDWVHDGAPDTDNDVPGVQPDTVDDNSELEMNADAPIALDD